MVCRRSFRIVNPWSINVETIGGKTTMIVGVPGKNSVLIWNELPKTWEEFAASGVYTENFYPQLVLQTEESSTPRAVTWTGRQLIVGDENIDPTTQSLSAFRVFNGFPTVSGLRAKKSAGSAITESTKTYSTGSGEQTQYFFSQSVSCQMEDFIYADTYGEGTVINGRLYLVCHGGIRVFKDGYIDDADDIGDIVASNTMADGTIGTNGGQVGFYVCGGGMGELFYDQDADVLFYTAFNDNQLVGWSSPESTFENAAVTSDTSGYRDCPLPDIKVGQDSYNLISTASSATIQFMHNPVPESDGEHLAVMDDLDQQLRIYSDGIPYSSGALPDYVFNKDGLMIKGLIVRVLVLPGHIDDAKKIIKYLYKTYNGR